MQTKDDKGMLAAVLQSEKSQTEFNEMLTWLISKSTIGMSGKNIRLKV